jgi:hypothetical protein
MGRPAIMRDAAFLAAGMPDRCPWAAASASEARRSVRCGEVAPAHAGARLRHGLTAGKPGTAIIVGDRFGAAGDQLLAGFRIPEFGPAGIGKHFLGRVGRSRSRVHECRALRRGLWMFPWSSASSRKSLIRTTSLMRPIRLSSGSPCLHRCVRQRQRQPLGGVARGDRLHHAGAADALAGAARGSPPAPATAPARGSPCQRLQRVGLVTAWTASWSAQSQMVWAASHSRSRT